MSCGPGLRVCGQSGPVTVFFDYDIHGLWTSPRTATRAEPLLLSGVSLDVRGCSSLPLRGSREHTAMTSENRDVEKLALPALVNYVVLSNSNGSVCVF